MTLCTNDSTWIFDPHWLGVIAYHSKNFAGRTGIVNNKKEIMNLTVTKTYNDWLILLQDLVDEKVTLDPQTKVGLDIAASAWPTCACGQLCNALPKLQSGIRSGAPLDTDLCALGAEFSIYISNGNYKTALRIFKKIEARSTYLLSLQNIE